MERCPSPIIFFLQKMRLFINYLGNTIKVHNLPNNIFLIKYSIKSSNVAQDLVMFFFFHTKGEKKTDKSFFGSLTIAPEVTFQ